MELIEKFKAWKHQRFLKKHGCETQEQYDRKYDPDIYPYADRVSDFYKGYPYHYIFFSPMQDPWNQFGDWLEGLALLKDWCNKNCQGKYRYDIHRVFKQTGIGLNGNTKEEWYLNDIGGSDYVFFAFKDPKDLTLFTLRWS